MKDFFGAFGIVAFDKKTFEHKIKVYEVDRVPKGDAVLSYDDPNAAHKSTEFFTGQLFEGSPITVVMCEKIAAPPSSGFGGRGGRGGYGGGRRY